jgi:hypothetical protein
VGDEGCRRAALRRWHLNLGREVAGTGVWDTGCSECKGPVVTQACETVSETIKQASGGGDCGDDTAEGATSSGKARQTCWETEDQ